MDKYIVIGEVQETQFEYEIGEIIKVNSTEQWQCKKKEVVDGTLMQYFSKGVLIFPEIE